ncbi:MAG TPA: patatin-like phospholipase family protein [Nitrososphaeraceae archaeon]|nr:patatin-like phospholipase family protein [Nitrososphaeraceae archaeon]
MIDINQYSNVSQRALVMQGGASLGSYEAGVFKAIYEKITKNNDQNGQKDKHFFDIVAGTSIGAIQGAIVVNYVVQNRKKGKSMYESWLGVDQILYDFWQDVATLTWVELDPTFPFRWNSFGYLYRDMAKTEAARRYYSVKELLMTGAKNMFSIPSTIPDKKFFDPVNTSYLYNNDPLRRLLENKYLKGFSLKTEPQEPRLLIVTVDVQEGTTVTFDSYASKTEYSHKHVIEYPNGITIDHVLASASIPVYYNFSKIEAKDSTRNFWDGAILSNTPLRELIGQHNTFWKEKIEDKGEDIVLKSIWRNDDNEDQDNNNKDIKVPDIEKVYIVNLWPKREEQIPIDHDGQIDRQNDILYHNKTEYDEKVAIFITDYIDLVKKIREIALENIDENKKAKLKNDINDFLLNNYAKSKFRKGENRKYIDLLKGRFTINKITRIDRQEDEYATSNKWADFSYKTINQLISDGYNQAKDQLKKE